MKQYAIFKKDGDKILSPYRAAEVPLGEWQEAGKRFGEYGDADCPIGLYAGDPQSLLYRNLSRKNEFVFECDCEGGKIDSEIKRCWERRRVVRELPHGELESLLKEESGRLGYNLYHALFPVNPRKIDFGEVTKNDIENLKKWASVWASVRDSVRASVKDSVSVSLRASVCASVSASVSASVRASVSASVSASVRASVWAYISSLFPNIKKWEYIDHKEGENPFQPAIDLWHRGLVPSFDGEVWRLHGGEKMEVVYEEKRK